MAEIPAHCPLGADGSNCRVKVHHSRERKTGPEHALVVVVCRCHGRHFTLYPLGHVPYGRKVVAPVDEAGHVKGEWEGTVFVAALEAAGGKAAWSRECDGRPGWRTQRRHIERAAQIVGLLCTARRAEQVAGRLAVGLGVHCPAREAYARAEGFRGRAHAVVRVLDAIEVDPQVPVRILRAGAAARVWSEPWVWQAGSWRAFPTRERSPEHA